MATDVSVGRGGESMPTRAQPPIQVQGQPPTMPPTMPPGTPPTFPPGTPPNTPPGLYTQAQTNPHLGDILQRIMEARMGRTPMQPQPVRGGVQGGFQGGPMQAQPFPFPAPPPAPSSPQHGGPLGFSGRYSPLAQLTAQYHASPYAPATPISTPGF